LFFPGIVGPPKGLLLLLAGIYSVTFAIWLHTVPNTKIKKWVYIKV